MLDIVAENQKPYRKALDAMIVVNPSLQYLFGTSADGTVKNSLLTFEQAYGGLTYSKNMRPGFINKQQKVMDFAGGGFINDGEAVPLNTTYTSTHNHTHYGVPAQTVNGSFSFDFGLSNNASLGDRVKSDFPMTVYAYDSKGNKYRASITATKYADTSQFVSFFKYHLNISKTDFDGFPENERLYIGYLDCLDTYIYENDQIINCMLNLRGCELNIVSPTMQGSEISVELRDAEEIKDISKGIRIQYLSGYVGMMSTPRTFYIDEYPQIDDIRKRVSIKGSDCTTRMSDVTDDLAFYRFYGSNIKKYVIANELIGRIFDHAIKYHQRHNYEYKGTNTLNNEANDIPTKINVSDQNIRTQLADANRWWNEDDFVFKYVDAGFPRWIALEQHTASSIYDYERTVSCNLGKENKTIPGTMISEFSVQSEEKPNRYNIELVDITNYPPTAEAAEVKQIAYKSSAVKDVEYKIVLSDGNDNKYKSFFAKKTSGSSEEHPIEAFMEGAQVTYYAPWSGALYVYGEILTKVEDTDHFAYGRNPNGKEYVETDEVFTQLYDRNGEEHVLRSDAAQKIANAPNLKYTFRWRGDPRMQPFDVITANNILMTVESLTLEHTEGGGFSSEVVARGGRW